MVMHKKSKVGFSYLLALGVVSFSRYAWLPWIVQYMHQRKYNSWPSTVSSYGLVLSCFYTGQYLGHLVTKFKMLNSSWFTISFMTLTGSFIALCVITRITLVLFLFGLMGFSGTILSGVSINVDSNTPQMAFLKKAGKIDINDNINHNLACFAFVIIIAGYLYDSHPLAQFPMYSLAVLLAIFCLLVMVYFVLISRTISARTKQSGYFGIAANQSTNELDVTQSKEDKSLDFSQSLVAEYTGPVPSNFLSCCGGNIVKARAMYGKALQWRKQQHVDDIFTTPQSHFHDILVYYPHAIHGYSLDGCAVVYEILGKGDMAGLKRTGASIDNIAWHFALRNELVFQKLLDPEFVKHNGGTLPPPSLPNNDPNVLPCTVGRMMTVLDVGGISFSAVNADVLSFIQKSGYLIDNYYPEQVSRLVICNAPSWFSTLWRMISSVLPPSIQKKVDILYDSKSLDKYIHPSQRPAAYGGTDVDLGHAPGHLEFLALEVKWREIQNKIPAPATTSSAPSDTKIENNKAQNQLVQSTALSSGSNGARKGVLGWFRTARPAYLGEGLSLRYNKSTGTWDDVADMEEEAYHLGKSSSRIAPSKTTVSTQEKIPANITKTKSTVDARSHNTTILQQQVAELGMVLAIHAAHRANARKDGACGSASIDMEEGFGSTGDLRNLNFRDEGPTHFENLSSVCDEQSNLVDITSGDNRVGLLPEGTFGRSRIDRERNLSGIKLSPTLFLIVVTGYIFCLWIQIVLFALIPVWMVIPASAGGMEYSVRETALVLSSAAIFALMGHKLLGRRCEQIVKSSPVRSLRIGCGLLLFVLFLLPFFMEYTTRAEEVTMSDTKPRIVMYNPVGGSEDGDVRFVNVFGRSLPSHVPVSYSTYASADHHNVAYDYVHWTSSKYTFHHRSILALQIPALLLSVMLCGLQLCRRASGVLLQLTLSAAFHAPSSVRRTLNGFVEIGGPTLAACLYSLLYGMGLKFPLDSSGFFWLSGCTILLVYIGSIMLKVQFRGDYGVMPDYKDNDTYERPNVLDSRSMNSLEGGIEINMERSGSETLESSHPYQRAGRRSGQGIHSTNRGTGSSTVVILNPWEELFNIPLSDASLLYTPAFAAYGSKLYNLKDDFKDV